MTSLLSQGFNSGVTLYHLARMRDSQEFQAELDVLRMKEIAHQFKFAGSVGDQVAVSLYLETVYLDGHLGLADGPGLGQAAPLLPAALPVQRPATRGHQAGRARRAVGEVQELLAASSPGHEGRTLQRLLVRPASLRQYSCKIYISPTISLHYQLPGPVQGTVLITPWNSSPPVNLH